MLLMQPALTRAITREDVLDLEAGRKQVGHPARTHSLSRALTDAPAHIVMTSTVCVQATAYAAMWRHVISSLQHMNKVRHPLHS